MVKRFERQLHESVQKALMKHFKETTAQQLKAMKALFFTEKGHLLCYPLGMGNPLNFFKQAIVELQVKELQKAVVKACCLHDKSNNEKQLMEGKYNIVYGT